MLCLPIRYESIAFNGLLFMFPNFNCLNAGLICLLSFFNHDPIKYVQIKRGTLYKVKLMSFVELCQSKLPNKMIN